MTCGTPSTLPEPGEKMDEAPNGISTTTLLVVARVNSVSSGLIDGQDNMRPWRCLL